MASGRRRVLDAAALGVAALAGIFGTSVDPWTGNNLAAVTSVVG